jgi:hypothetical protein
MGEYYWAITQAAGRLYSNVLDLDFNWTSFHMYTKLALVQNSTFKESYGR